MSDEIPTVAIGGLHRIAYDRRPPASRMTQKAEGVYGEEIEFERREQIPSPPIVSTDPRWRPEIVRQQPYHQRVRIHWRKFLGV